MEFFSEIIYRNKFLIENGSHNRDAMIIVLEGSFECIIDEKTFIAGPGDICVFYASTYFQRRVLRPIRCLYIQFEQLTLPLPAGILECGDPVRTENTISHLTQAVEQENKILAEHFLMDLFLLHLHQNSLKPLNDKTVSACIAYMTAKLDRRITLELLAKEFSISKQGLIRKFRKYTDKTPMEYLSTLRLNRSKQLLKDTTQSVSEIAQLCGFENVYYFSNHFKHVTGISPTGYRKLMDL